MATPSDKAPEVRSEEIIWQPGAATGNLLAVSREFQADGTCTRRPSAFSKRSSLRNGAACMGTPPSGPWSQV
jgi:hypothetical protein